MFGQLWKHQISFKQFSLCHENPTIFITSQWQEDKFKPNFKYCLYRLIIFTTFFVSWIFTYIKETPAGRPRWPIYLTNWGFTLCMLQNLLCSIMLIVSLLAEKSFVTSQWKEKVLKMYPTYWVINIIATPVAFTISIIYWTLIFGTEDQTFTAINFIVHGINSILIFLDLWIVCHPIQILHVIYPLVFSFAYTLFTIIFYSAGGTTKTGSRYIYTILKWDQPEKSLGVCAGVMVLMIFLHTFSFFVYKIRVKLYKTLFLTKIEPTFPKKKQNQQIGYDNKAIVNEYV